MFKKFSETIFLLLTISWFLYLSSEVKAIPAFARKTNFSCAVCHFPSFPRLNSFGWAFKENGYQVPGVDDVIQTQIATKPDENLELLKYIPVAISIQGNVQLKASHPQIDFQIPEAVELLAGGRIFKNVSFFYMQNLGSASSGPEPVTKGFIQANNLIKDGILNFRAGRFGVLDWDLDSSRNLTKSEYLIQNSEFINNPFTLSTNQVGLEIYGRPGPVFYHLGIFNGNLAPMGGSIETVSLPGDNNNFKDISGGINFNLFNDHRLTFFGYFGQASIPVNKSVLTTSNVNMSGMRIKVETPSASIATRNVYFYNTGTTLTLNLIPFQVVGMYGFSQNLDIEKTTVHGGFLEANYSFNPDISGYKPLIIGIARYDILSENTGNKTVISSTITPAIKFLLMTNLSLVLEYNINLSDISKSIGLLSTETVF